MTSAITHTEPAIHPDVVISERRWLIQQLETHSLALAQKLHDANAAIRLLNAALQEAEAKLKEAGLLEESEAIDEGGDVLVEEA